MEVRKQNKERMELNRFLAEEAPPVYFLFFAFQNRYRSRHEVSLHVRSKLTKISGFFYVLHLSAYAKLRTFRC